LARSETLFFWIAVALYLASSVVYIGAFAFRRPRWLGLALRLALVGFAAHSGTIVARWVATGHPPVMRDYENAVAGAWVIVALYVALCYRYRWLRGLGLPLVPLAMLMLGYGLLSNPRLEPLTPAYKSFWLAVHVVFAWFAYSGYVVATGLAVLYLLRRRQPGLVGMANGEAGSANVGAGRFAIGDWRLGGRRLPAGELLDELSYRLVTFGFLADAVMLVAGSIWASRLWGSYWAWDPVETWSLISWLTYAVYLHVRVTLRWRGERMAWFAIAALSTVIVSFWGVNYVAGTLHSFRSI